MLNKADLVGGVNHVPVRDGMIAVSAITGEGLPELENAIDHRISAGMEEADYTLPHSDGAKLAWLYEHGEVIGREDDEEAARVRVRLLPEDRARFERDTRH